MSKKQLIKTFVFLILGILIFVYVYKDLKVGKIGHALNSLHYEWIVLSGVLGISSHFVRALRWQLLIQPLAHKPRTLNTFLAVLVLYLFNILIPRGGEIARCSVLSRYEKIAFPKLLGTVVTERLSDLAVFFLILLFLILWDAPFLMELFNNNPQLVNGFQSVFHSKYLYIGLLVIAVGVFVFIYSGKRSKFKVMDKILKLKDQFREGVATIYKSNNKFLYVFYTLFIIFLWLLMFYVVFFAYDPTAHLSFRVAVVTFAISSFAFILPIQAGIGAWHFLVIQCLLLFGIDMDTGAVFALVAHTFTNLTFLVIGTLAFILLPFINKRKEEKIKFREIAQREEVS